MQIFLTNTSRFTTGSVADLDLDFLAQRLKTDGALENMTGWRPFPGKPANMLQICCTLYQPIYYNAPP